jgi:hypothetical protein
MRDTSSILSLVPVGMRIISPSLFVFQVMVLAISFYWIVAFLIKKNPLVRHITTR